MGGAFDFANPSDLLRGPAKLDLAGVVSLIFRKGVQPAGTGPIPHGSNLIRQKIYGSNKKWFEYLL
ncbi:MAG: hypothetical protein A3H42_05520 [Deltaproteobacteria bacterium RIFCSPLOWO2_02_FULL_46_8]|nr:MAG: hypothetical protein A3H42_05520 [Deltaproteobacteria bacterium RIFCSPLOWO2_02_FULL_46_8]